MSWPCFTATKNTVAPIIKKAIKPDTNDKEGDPFDKETQLSSMIMIPIIVVIKTQTKIPVSKALS